MGLLENDLVLDEYLGRLDLGRRRGLRCMETGLLSCLLVGDSWCLERERREERWRGGGCCILEE